MFVIFRAALLETETMENANSTKTIRYIRRRKKGQKRRSIIVKRRFPSNCKINKHESIISHDDTSTKATSMNNNENEHSQEYQSRLHESTKGEDKTMTSPRITLKQPALKQLKLHQFLETSQLTDNLPVDDKLKLNHPSHTNSEAKHENSDHIYAQSRRITRFTRLNSTSKSEVDLITTSNEMTSEILNRSDCTYIIQFIFHHNYELEKTSN